MLCALDARSPGSLGSNINVLAINETKLDSSITNDLIRRDRQLHSRNGGGVCMYVESKLNFKIREDLVNNDLELLFIQISNPRSKPFLVGTWYGPFIGRRLWAIILPFCCTYRETEQLLS